MSQFKVFPTFQKYDLVNKPDKDQANFKDESSVEMNRNRSVQIFQLSKI
jgi:hypothetical protein